MPVAQLEEKIAAVDENPEGLAGDEHRIAPVECVDEEQDPAADREEPERDGHHALSRALAAGAPRLGLVSGQRTARKATSFKKLQSRIANAVRSAVLRDGTRDTGCGLKAFPREVFLALPYFDGLHRFLPALVRREGYDIGYVDVVDRLRRTGMSNYGMWDRLWIGILDLAGVWWLIRRRKRVPQASEVKRNAD